MFAAAWVFAMLEGILDVENSDEGVTMLILINDQELFVGVRELNLLGLDSWHCQLSEKITVCCVIDLYSLSSGSGEKHFRILSHVDTLAGVVDLEETDSLEILGFIHTHGLVIAAGKQKVTVEVEEHLLHWTGVSSQVNWLH
jgi:hypothetical protein